MLRITIICKDATSVQHTDSMRAAVFACPSHETAALEQWLGRRWHESLE